MVNIDINRGEEGGEEGGEARLHQGDQDALGVHEVAEGEWLGVARGEEAEEGEGLYEGRHSLWHRVVSRACRALAMLSKQHPFNGPFPAPPPSACWVIVEPELEREGVGLTGRKPTPV